MQLYETTVTKIAQETSDSYSFFMRIPEGYTWQAGQHALWKLSGYDVAEDDRPSRIFTIASAPEDGFLMFTTRIADPHSSFKDVLLHQLKAGDPMLVANPKGSFAFHRNHPQSLVIAGGIGITPIRSLLAHAAVQNADPDHKITVFYSDDRGEFCYGDFWKKVESAMPNLELHLISDRDEFTERVNTFAKTVGNDAEYLIAGSPGMNKAFTATLTGLGVAEDQIVVDNFMGY
jgi:ferredoxin-NADP reductase